MRLHTLEVTAFGPFAATERVDFDDLGADGLFLLHGQTGAGKTTILDAVAFALFGTVPGARRDGKRLMSDHAAPGARPAVMLEATLGGHRVRLVRSPEYERPKRRGTGTMTENACATLEWLDGSRENLSRIPDIATEVGRLLGMSADQFFQVVLLPQGEFARFLRAETEERAELLEKLFDTARFGDVESWFVERRRASAAAVAEQRHRIDVTTGRLSTAAGVDVPGSPGYEVPGHEDDDLSRLRVWTTGLQRTATSAKDAAAETLRVIRAKERVAAEELAGAQRCRELQRRGDEARRELRALDELADHRLALAAELDAAHRAEPVAWAADELRQAVEEVEAAQQAADAARRPVAADPDGAAALGGVDGDAEVDRDDLRTAARDWDREVASLDELLVAENEAAQWDRDLETWSTERTRLEDEAERLTTELAALPATVAQRQHQLDEARRAGDRLPELASARERAQNAVEAGRELLTLRGKRDQQADELTRLRGDHNDARSQWLDLRERRINGMASELAAGLVDGRPCAVCGATAHPDPALGEASSVVTVDDERAAQEAEQGAAKTVEEATRRLHDVDAAIELCRQRCDGLPLADLENRLRAAATAYDRLNADAAQVDSLAASVDELREQERLDHERSREIGTRLAALSERVATAVDRIDRLRVRVEAARGDDRTARQRRDRLSALSAAIVRYADATGTVTRARREVGERREKLDALAVSAGFSTAAEALGAVRPPNHQQGISDKLEDARVRDGKARSVLAENEIAAALDQPAVDVDGARIRHEQIGDELTHAVASDGDARRRHGEVQKLADDLLAALDAFEPLAREHEELAALSDVVCGRGQNARKMSLSSYVLAARLEDVAVVASRRLKDMSGGRYEFVHSDAAGPRGRRGGLGLDIRDDYTGAVRSAKTLSGGETFMASLALALGLADVVSAEAGGITLDTLFIDEGFGSLDPDALDLVMGVLDELRAGGRVVGVVSHVDEMKLRIPNRLNVVRGRNGSTLRVSSAAVV